jgi:hypothetical protein
VLGYSIVREATAPQAPYATVLTSDAHVRKCAVVANDPRHCRSRACARRSAPPELPSCLAPCQVLSATTNRAPTRVRCDAECITTPSDTVSIALFGSQVRVLCEFSDHSAGGACSTCAVALNLSFGTCTHAHDRTTGRRKWGRPQPVVRCRAT